MIEHFEKTAAKKKKIKELHQRGKDSKGFNLALINLWKMF